jgi:hypothetical protein
LEIGNKKFGSACSYTGCHSWLLRAIGDIIECYKFKTLRVDPASITFAYTFIPKCLAMSTESTPLISQSSSQYFSIPSNAPNTSPQPLSHPFKPYSHSFTSPYEIYNYCSASKVLENRGSVARDHLGKKNSERRKIYSHALGCPIMRRMMP